VALPAGLAELVIGAPVDADEEVPAGVPVEPEGPVLRGLAPTSVPTDSGVWTLCVAGGPDGMGASDWSLIAPEAAMIPAASCSLIARPAEARASPRN
jgi:hypothetical protein